MAVPDELWTKPGTLLGCDRLDGWFVPVRQYDAIVTALVRVTCVADRGPARC